MRRLKSQYKNANESGDQSFICAMAGYICAGIVHARESRWRIWRIKEIQCGN